MVSKIIEHLEQYNKEMNIKAYYDKLHTCEKTKDEMDEREFFKCLLQASIEGVKKSHNLTGGNHINIEKETDKIMKDYNVQAELFKNYSVMVLIESWLLYKQIYSFDKDTLNLLISNEYSNLSYDELKALKMPFETIAIENDIEYEGHILDSIFLCKKLRPKTNNILISICAFVKVNPEDSTKLIRFDLLIGEGKSLFDELPDDDEEAKNFICKVMNLVLYLCQPKVDVIYKKSEKKPMKQAMPKHFYSVDYATNEVGCRLGNAIRKYRYVYETTGEKKHTGGVKRPHTRSGHFHHYWVGKGRTDLIVKYVEPTFVLGGSKDATLHNVK